jgi:hypothetical protein
MNTPQVCTCQTVIQDDCPFHATHNHLTDTTPTPRTDAEIEDWENGLRHMANDHLCCRATVLDTIELLNELKRERDQLKKQFEISKGNTEAALNSFHAEMKQRRNAQAERDQLRKVAENFRDCMVDVRQKMQIDKMLRRPVPSVSLELQIDETIESFDSLTHVIERNKTK